MRPRTEEVRGGPLAAEEVDRLAARVRHQLSGRLRQFWIEVRDGGLVLRGRAPTYYAKQLAQHAVLSATDVPILHNEIEVS